MTSVMEKGRVMKDILKFSVKCLLAPFLIIMGTSIAGKILGWAANDSNDTTE